MMEIPNNLLSASISRGDILHGVFEGIDHGKFFVIMGISKSEVCGFCFINSNIHKSLQKKPKQFALQYPLMTRDYEFLDHTSFINTVSVRSIPLQKIVKDINDGCTKIVSRLTDEHIADIVNMVLESDVIGERVKDLYFR